MKQNPEKKFKNTVEMTVASIDVISKEPKRLRNLLQILNTSILCCVILFSSPSLTSIYGFESTKPEIGMNIYSCRYFSSQIMFVDAMKSAMPWITNNIIQNKISESVWDTGHIEKIKKTENGYPTHLPVQISDVSHPQTVATLMMRGLEGNYPSGLYHVFYDGIGRLQFGFDAKIVKEEYGKITIKVKPSNNGIYLKILKSDKNAPVRNIRVILPGFENTYKDQPFYPAFLERLHFCKVLRFMDTARTNNSKLIKWKNRTKPDY